MWVLIMSKVMSKYMLVFLLFSVLNFMSAYAQPIKLGVGILHCFKNSSTDTGIGAEPFAEYQITDKNICQGSCRAASFII